MNVVLMLSDSFLEITDCRRKRSENFKYVFWYIYFNVVIHMSKCIMLYVNVDMQLQYQNLHGEMHPSTPRGNSKEVQWKWK